MTKDIVFTVNIPRNIVFTAVKIIKDIVFTAVFITRTSS
jgi:hypothetical protein